jgi:hypothetical protein
MEFKYRFPFQIPTSFLPRPPSDVWHDTDHAKMLLALALRPLVNPWGLISSSDVATSSSTYFLNMCTIQVFQKPQTLLQDKESGFGFVRANPRTPKPRKNGVTEIRGPYYSVMGKRYLSDILETMSYHVDGLKFAGGSFTLFPERNCVN